MYASDTPPLEASDQRGAHRVDPAVVDFLKVHNMPDRTLDPNSGAQTSLPILLTDAEAARFLNVGLTTFHELRGHPWFPAAIQLGPRLVRWSRAELEQAVGNMPRQAERSEPAQLARGRINRLKDGA